MVRVIKRIHKPVNGPWRYDCHKCGSTLEFDSKDRAARRKKQSLNYQCPDCNAHLRYEEVES